MKHILILLVLLSPPLISAQESQEDLVKKYHQFDFWLGSWEVYKYGTDTLVGQSNIESIIDGLGLLENYTVHKGKYQGKSLNKYNPAKKRWEQYWIDNSGLTLFLSGGLKEGKMVLDDAEHGDEAAGLNRITWEKTGNGSVRQTWNISMDGGQSWSVAFDGEYKPVK